MTACVLAWIVYRGHFVVYYSLCDLVDLDGLKRTWAECCALYAVSFQGRGRTASAGAYGSSALYSLPIYPRRLLKDLHGDHRHVVIGTV